MLTNCPNCQTRVLPNADGTCPACREIIFIKPKRKLVNQKVEQKVDQLTEVNSQSHIKTSNSTKIMNYYGNKILNRLFIGDGRQNIAIWLIMGIGFMLFLILTFIFSKISGNQVINEPFRSIIISILPLTIVVVFVYLYSIQLIPFDNFGIFSIKGLPARIISMFCIIVFLLLTIWFILSGFSITLFS